MASDKKRTREYRAFPQSLDKTPRARHCAADTDNAATRERIARPITAVPRRAADWR